ncbi:bile acid:sodium symporter family protein [Bacillus sp. FJAT-49736]|uniref:bile acid:sodium symporter family protein n=1 Tax=Bacillus sp. FJAT-49736 TaxID=2833582 RepID=UPI001BC99292|nr:bile acid:sodium symporter family protein [Bacillus sp. FJAT-49736]MBS4174220.1 bile acid:sodium symporter family protein [Bacillus sp. FJAT-49736]
MLAIMNKRLEKWMPFITPISVILGVLLSVYLKDFSFLIPWIFAFMTFAGSLGSNFHSLKKVMTHPFSIIIALLILHIVMPIWAWGMGHVFFHGDSYTMTGLILGMVIPTGVTSVIWVSIYRGNMALTLSLILIDTFLSPFIVPYTLSIFVGQRVELNTLGIMKGLFEMVVAPSILAMLLNQITKGRIKDTLGTKLAPFSKVCLGLVVMLNGAVIAPHLKHISLKLFGIGAVVLLIAFTGYLFSFLIGRLLRRDNETTVALTFLGGMRNISAGAVIAVTYFHPSVATPVIISMLFQQVLASFFGFVIDRYFRINGNSRREIA